MIKEFFKGIRKGQKSFGEDIQSIINFFMLTFVYFVGIGLTSIFAKIFGKHFLELNFDKKTETYWSELNLTKKSMEEYYRQF